MPFKPDGPGLVVGIVFTLVMMLYHRSWIGQILPWRGHVQAPPKVDSAEPAIAKADEPQTVEHDQVDSSDHIDIKLDSEPLGDANAHDLLPSDDAIVNRPVSDSPESALSLPSLESPDTANHIDPNEQESEHPTPSAATDEYTPPEDTNDPDVVETAYSLPPAVQLELESQSTLEPGQLYCTYMRDPRRPEYVLFKVGNKRSGLSMNRALQKQRKCGTSLPNLVGRWPSLATDAETPEEAMLQYCRRADKAAQKAMKIECLDILAYFFGDEEAERILDDLCQCGSRHVKVFPFPLTETLTIEYWVQRAQLVFDHVVEAAMDIERAASASQPLKGEA